MTRMPESEVIASLAAMDGWTRAGAEITKTWSFLSFVGAIEFVNRVAALAEAADHHPHIEIDYRKVRLALSTHSAGGLTRKDFALAAQIDRSEPI